jgi:hypothetical protein
LPGRVQAIHLWHLKIKHDQIRPELLETLHCFLAVRSFNADCPIVLLFEQAPKVAAHSWIVVRYKNSNHKVSNLNLLAPQV